MPTVILALTLLAQTPNQRLVDRPEPGNFTAQALALAQQVKLELIRTKEPGALAELRAYAMHSDSLQLWIAYVRRQRPLSPQGRRMIQDNLRELAQKYPHTSLGRFVRVGIAH
jgi:hypothetical protein